MNTRHYCGAMQCNEEPYCNMSSYQHESRTGWLRPICFHKHQNLEFIYTTPISVTLLELLPHLHL